MKRIICLLLAVVCVFALSSCGDKELEGFIELIDASEPTRIVTQTQVSAEVEGEVVSLSGRFVTDIDGKNSVTAYKYQRFAIPGVDPADADDIMSIEGTVYYKDGKFSEDGENWSAESPDLGALLLDFNFTAESVANYKISGGGTVLTATLTLDEAAAVFGKTFENIKDSSVKLVMETNGNHLTKKSIEYTVLNGETESTVFVETSYTYMPVTSEGGAE